jgi:hypothetical protein
MKKKKVVMASVALTLDEKKKLERIRKTLLYRRGGIGSISVSDVLRFGLQRIDVDDL